jgi:hypothetical protein
MYFHLCGLILDASFDPCDLATIRMWDFSFLGVGLIIPAAFKHAVFKVLL